MTFKNYHGSMTEEPLTAVGSHAGPGAEKVMNAYPMVEILWLDAVTMTGSDWTELADVTAAAMPSRTVGMLVKESDEAITVCALANTTHIGLGVTVPRRMIDSITYLKATKSRPKSVSAAA